MCLMKNPWGHFSWKGRYSFGERSWTPQLKQAFGYDNFKKDHGVFWMCFDDVVANFVHLDINWNPEML